VVIRRALLVTAALLLVGAAAYLHDPPWIGQVTSGLLDWEEDPPGTRFRWTAGRATFYVPSDATTMVLPLRSYFGPEYRGAVTVRVDVDDRWLADIVLDNPDVWRRPTLPLPRRGSSRAYRRVDLHVSQTVGPFILGVQTGVVELERQRR
jgi:hypothetical protein